MALKFALVRKVNPTSNGTYDFTDSGFGTPVAAIFVVNAATADGSASVNSQSSFGATDGTRQWVSSFQDEDGVGTTECNRFSDTAYCIVLRSGDNGSNTLRAEFDSWITDGVRLDFINTPGTANLSITCILIGGSGASARVDCKAITATEDNAQDINDVGFEPKFVIATHTNQSCDAGTGGFVVNSYGFASNINSSVSQCSAGYYYVDNTGTSRCCAEVNDGYIITIAGYSGTDGYLEIGSFDSSGFSITPRDADGNSNGFKYIALTDSSSGGKAQVETIATGTGNKSYTGYGVKPSFIMLLANQITDVDTAQTNSIKASVISHNFAVDGDGESSHNHLSRNNQSTTDTAQRRDNSIQMMNDDNDGIGSESTVNSYDSDGFTLNFSAHSPGSTKVWPVLAIGEEAATRIYDFMPFFNSKF